jgi:hypothetical protein
MERLHRGGDDDAGGKGDEHPQPGADGGKRQAALVDVEHHQHEHRQRHDREQLDGGQAHVHVGVAGPACDRVVRQHEVVAVDVEITRRPDEGHDGEDQRQVRRDARVDAWRRSLEPEAPVQVVADRGDDQEHQQRHEGPVDQEGEERQLEHVEADRLVEHPGQVARRRPEGLTVAEQQPVLPLAARRGPDEKGEDGRDDRAQRKGVPADDLLVPADELELGRDEQRPWCNAVHDPQADPAGDEEDADECRREPELGLDHGAPDHGEVHRPVPEVVRVEVRDPLHDDQQQDQEDDGRQDPCLVAPDRARPGRQIRWNSHEAGA